MSARGYVGTVLTTEVCGGVGLVGLVRLVGLESEEWMGGVYSSTRCAGGEE